MNSPITFSHKIHRSSINSVIYYLDQTIHYYEKWQHVALIGQKVALRIIATTLICTALLYASPAIPFIGLISFAILNVFIFSSKRNFLSSIHWCSVILLFPLAFGLANKLIVLIYTKEIVIIALIANGILIGSTSLFTFLTIKMRNIFEKNQLYFQDLYKHAKNLASDFTYSPPPNMRQALRSIYKKVHIKPYVYGHISFLPYEVEKQMAQLDWGKG